MAKLTKNDKAWQTLFDELNILDYIEKYGLFNITADTIKEIGDREPRLMTKFDHKSQRPKLFNKKNLSILPVSRGSYVIGKFKAYENIDFEAKHPIKKELPNHLESFDVANITSESIALNIAHASGMIDHVMGTNDICSILTLSGRMKSMQFEYTVGRTYRQTIQVDNSQIEIDGGYENLDKIAIIEAKNRVPDDFIVRQLYYPYRLIASKQYNKEIIPIFFTYTDEIFSFHIYRFNDLIDYSSIEKVNQIDFVLNETIDITMEEIISIAKRSKYNYVEENTTFPQADTFVRVLDLLDFLATPRSKQEVQEHYEFHERQSDYHFNSLKYLDLSKRTEERPSRYMLTELGKKVEKMRNSKERNLFIIGKLLEHKPLNIIFNHYIYNGGDVDKDYIKQTILKYGVDSNGNSLGTNTINRRTQSAISWIEWILGNAVD